MTIGPVQLIVLGFDHPEFRGEVLAELDRLKDNDLVRVIDSLLVYKDENGNVESRKRSDLSNEEAAEFGMVVGALIGLGAGGEEGMEAGAAAGREAAAGGVQIFTEEDSWDVVDDIPEGTAAAIVLLEHRWAIPLREALWRANGFRIADAFIRPLDLVGVGLLSAAEAEAITADATRA